MQAIEKKWLGWQSAAGCALAALTFTSCATKTATLHSTPYFHPTATRQATNAVDAGDGDLEIASLRRNMMAHPDDLDARLRLAQMYAARGFPDVALEHYRLAAERFPDSPNAALRLARTLRAAGQKEEALAGLRAFVKAHPQHAVEPYEWLGILNDDLKNWKDSQLAYETALLYVSPASPAAAELHNNLGYALLMQSWNSSAAVEFRAALSIQHDLAIARNNLGMALAADPAADRKDAILNWQAVSGPAAAHNNMAALLIERGDYTGARTELATALGFDQQNAQAIYNLALVSERDGKPAVIPAETNATAKTAKAPNPFWKFLRMARHEEKRSATSPAAAQMKVPVESRRDAPTAGKPPDGQVPAIGQPGIGQPGIGQPMDKPLVSAGSGNGN